MQVYGRALAVGQLTYGIPHGCVLGVVRRNRRRVALGVELYGALLPPRFRQVMTPIHRHPQKPRLHVLGTFKRRRIVVQTQKHVLIHILGIGARPRVAQRQPIHRVTPISHSLREKRLGAGPRTLLVRHALTSSTKHTIKQPQLFQSMGKWPKSFVTPPPKEKCDALRATNYAKTLLSFLSL